MVGFLKNIHCSELHYFEINVEATVHFAPCPCLDSADIGFDLSKE